MNLKKIDAKLKVLYVEKQKAEEKKKELIKDLDGKIADVQNQINELEKIKSQTVKLIKQQEELMRQAEESMNQKKKLVASEVNLEKEDE